MSNDFRYLQFEQLLPFQLRERLAMRPVVYIPLGTLEWHGEHLPVGLDAMTAHGLCIRASAQDGGVVLPPLHYGTGGGHGNYPWTIIKSEPNEIEAQLHFTLERLQTFGVKLAVLFSGHFADTQLDMIDRVAVDWNRRVTALKVVATAVNRIEGLPFAPDHAAIFETTLLASIHPELVKIDRLASTSAASLDAAENDFGEQRHDTNHPIWGVFGPDPRHFKKEHAKPLQDACVTWLVAKVRANF